MGADHDTKARAIGALVGSAVGDALGAPFEFGPPGAYRRRFAAPAPQPPGEMVGGGAFGWEPGEFTDDTQMALALAESLLTNGGFEPADIWTRFRAWAARAKDVGVITRRALEHASFAGAAQAAHDELGRSAGNGGLMRATPIALFTLDWARDAAMELACRQAALTHADPAAGWGAAIGVELVRLGVHGGDPFASLFDIVGHVPADHRTRFAEMLDPSWRPSTTVLPNGTVWTCLAEAVRAARSAGSFEDAVVAAIELGGDTDTVACVTGALAGAMFGIDAIPERWRSMIHGTVDTPNGNVRYDVSALERVARRLHSSAEDDR
jgi:ADP-ribosyl-[dinitrogen reductase] hydrolase